MKIYEIIDKYKKLKIGYLFYYEKNNNCYIEICDDIDEWDLPPILDYFVRNGSRTVPEYWAMKWVENRIVPKDRQNLGSILKDAGLDVYDEMKLLIWSDGRCAQDDCYIRKISLNDLDQSIKKRREKMILTLSRDKNNSNEYMATFKDGSVGVINLKNINKYKAFERIQAYYDKINGIRLNQDGSGISLSESKCISYAELYDSIEKLPISVEMLDAYAVSRFISSAEITQKYMCTRQYVDDLVKRGRLIPVDITSTNTFFIRTDVEAVLGEK